MQFAIATSCRSFEILLSCRKTVYRQATDARRSRTERAICEIGRRIYERGFVAANAGNITCGSTDDEVLCTPTMISKGFMTAGRPVLDRHDGQAARRQAAASSEALMHLEILKARPDVECVVHCHPPHATAFAIVGEPIPQAVMPEVEVFLGEVPITKYETPGGKKFAETVLPFVAKTNTIILANHGTVSYGESPERAYWLTEVLDQYCRMLMLTRQLGPLRLFAGGEGRGADGREAKDGLRRPALRRRFQRRHARQRARSATRAEYGVTPQALSAASS